VLDCVDYKLLVPKAINYLNEEELKYLTDFSRDGWEIKTATPMNISGTTRSICYTLQRKKEN
jgi:hypothetical protein